MNRIRVNSVSMRDGKVIIKWEFNGHDGRVLLEQKTKEVLDAGGMCGIILDFIVEEGVRKLGEAD